MFSLGLSLYLLGVNGFSRLTEGMESFFGFWQRSLEVVVVEKL